MKCSGKYQLYPSEVDSINKKQKEQKFADAINQAEINKHNLKILNERIQSGAENITDTFESEVENFEDHLQNRTEEFKEQLNSLTDEVNNLRANVTESIDRVETATQVRPLLFMINKYSLYDIVYMI